MAQNQLQQEQTLTAPLEAYNTNLVNSVNSGNYGAAISAAGPAITNLTTTNAQATEQINNAVPAGPGRDYAIAQAKEQQGTNVATTLNQLYQQALQGNAQIGQAAAGIGLQESGAALNAGASASSSNQSVMSAEEQSKSSTLGFLGSLASTGASFFPVV
jgi:hypothetical protein